MFLFCLCLAAAGAQDIATPATAVTAVTPSLPVLQVEVPPVYPAEALAAQASAVVLLQLGVDAQGQVVEVGVLEGAALTLPPDQVSLGPALDAAAVQAARSFRFEPALDAAGQPTTAVIGYRLRFEPELAPPRSVEGWIRQAGTRTPLSTAEVELLGPDGEQRSLQVDADGAFEAAGLTDGRWLLSARARGHQADGVAFEVRTGQVSQVTLSLVEDRPWESAEQGLVVEIVERRATADVTERVLAAEDIQVLPGTNGDVVRVVQNLPGVQRPPLNIGQLLIRGTAPENSRTYLDGVNLPLVFHFGGLTTVLNGDAIDEVVFLPGNYSARYGRTLGGVVDIQTRPALPEQNRGYLSVDLYQSTAFVERKLGERTALTVSGRRSYIDAVLNPVLNRVSDAGVRAPRYYDLQARLVHETPGGTRLDGMFLLSDDRFLVVGEGEDGEDVPQIGLVQAFQKVRLQVERPLPNGWRFESALMAGPETQEFLLEEGQAYEKELTFNLRAEVIRDAEWLDLRFGTDWIEAYERLLYDIPIIQDTKESAERWVHRPALYAEAGLTLGPVRVSPGLRSDLMIVDDILIPTLDPRLGARWTVTDDVAVFGGVGKYSQFPELREVLPSTGGTPSLSAERALQTSLGVSWQVRSPLSVELTGFYNRLDRLVVGREGRFEFYTGPPPIGPFDTGDYANDGVGTIYGAEALVRWQSERILGWVAATWSRSLRQDRPDSDVELFPYDQPLVVNALGTWLLPRGWRLGGRFRYGTGNPYTPVVNRVYDLDSRAFIPIYGERDSARLPAFWAVDLRIDKDFVFDRWTLTTYLDVQNVLTGENVEVLSWTYDYGEPSFISGLPILPVFGLKGAW